MPRGDLWNHYTTADWAALANAWLEEMRGGKSPESSDFGQTVVLMNFTATAEQQWRFICAAVASAQSDNELASVASGPLEHLLGHHGDEYVGLVEEKAKADRVFARAVTGMKKYMMSDTVWSRVQAIQRAALDPL